MWFPFRRKTQIKGVYSPEKIAERWSDLASVGDFRPTDTVLDMGCCEGIVSLEVAPLVAHVHGVELKERWVERAKAEAKRRRITNATFEQGSALDYQPIPYDVVLLLGVLGKADDGGRAVGLGVLSRLALAAKRLIVIRYGVDKPGHFTWTEINSLLAKHGFEAECLPREHNRGNLIIGISP